MRNLGYFLLLSISILISSCQKELDDSVLTSGTGGSGGSSNGDLLIKSDGRSGSDSTVTTYTYNSAKKLISYQINTSVNGGSHTYYGFERDTAGLIVRRRQYTTSALLPVAADTSVTIYHYSAGTSPQITYSTANISAAGLDVIDSTLYTYNAAGKLTKTEDYLISALIGTAVQGQRFVYTYDASGNVSKVQTYNLQTGLPILLTTNDFTYDSKTPAQSITEAEAIAVLSQPAAIHNPVTYLVSSTLVTGFSINYTYTYNSSGRPATSKESRTATGATTATVTNYTFYYQ